MAILLSLLSTLIVAGMSYHVYKMNYIHTRIDNYLNQIVNLYYKIEDDAKIVKSNICNHANEELIAQCYRQIETNATLMRYYVVKYPIIYDGKKEFEKVINSIAHSPEGIGDYDKLSDEFKKFCDGIEKMNEPETVIYKRLRKK